MPTAAAARPRLHVHALIDSLVWGGAELLLADFAAAAPMADIDVSVGYLVDDPEGSPGADRLRERAGIEAELIGIPRMVNPRAEQLVYRHLRAVRPHVLHTHLGYSDALGGAAARLLGIPSVATIHVMDRGETPRDRLRSSVMALVRRRTAARVVAVSDAARQWLVAVGEDSPERIVTVHNGIAADVAPGSGRGFREEFGIGTDEVVASMVTVLRPGKGHEIATAAVEALRERHPRLRLVIAGDGPTRAEVRSLASRLGEGAVLTGHRTDVMALLDATDVLVHPSYADAFPTSLIEAGAASVPVVATRVGGVPEIVEPGRTGVLLDPPPRARDLVEALEPLVADAGLRRRMGEAGRARYEAEFTAQRWAERLRALYDTVLAERSFSRGRRAGAARSWR